MPDAPDIFKKRPRKIRNTKAWEAMSKKSDDSQEAEFNQAEKVIAKLGGPRAVARLLGIHHGTVYRWMDARWSNGIIPTKPAAKIRRIARANGILLTKEDWMPEARIIKVEED